MEPASKVSVPLTVVMRMRSSVPESVLLPAAKNIVFAPASLLKDPDPTHALLPNEENTMLPLRVEAEPILAVVVIKKPVVPL